MKSNKHKYSKYPPIYTADNSAPFVLLSEIDKPAVVNIVSSYARTRPWPDGMMINDAVYLKDFVAAIGKHNLMRSIDRMPLTKAFILDRFTSEIEEPYYYS